MAFEGNVIGNGWPLGLGNMNSRITVVEPPRSLLFSTSFSSFSSSELDTESTSSFFPDQSVTLGRLIGIGPTNNHNNNNKRGLFNEHLKRADGQRTRHFGVPKCCRGNSQRFCAPLLHRVMGKKGRNGNRH